MTPAEIGLAARIGFDEEVVRLVKSALNKDVEPYEIFVGLFGSENAVGADEETDGKGLTVKLADAYDDTWHLDKLYRVRGLLPPGYSAFVTEDYNYRPGLTVLKTSDPYEIIRVQKTQGWDFDDRNYFWKTLLKFLKNGKPGAAST